MEIPWACAHHHRGATFLLTVVAISALARQTIDQRVRRYRKWAGSIQQALARAAEIRKATLVRLEKRQHSLSFKTVKTFADAFGTEARIFWSSRNC